MLINSKGFLCCIWCSFIISAQHTLRCIKSKSWIKLYWKRAQASIEINICKGLEDLGLEDGFGLLRWIWDMLPNLGSEFKDYGLPEGLVPP